MNTHTATDLESALDTCEVRHWFGEEILIDLCSIGIDEIYFIPNVYKHDLMKYQGRINSDNLNELAREYAKDHLDEIIFNEP